jgi:hypothetical protein
MAVVSNNPLKSLYTDQSGIKTLIYPSDLGSPKKGHWITFTISVPQKSTYNKNSIDISTIPYNTNLTDAYRFNISNSIQNAVDSANKNLGGTANNAPIPKLWEYTVTPGTTKITTVISLYTPDTVSTTQHSHYTAESLTEATGAYGMAASLINDAMNQFKGIKNIATEQLTAAFMASDTGTRAALKSQGSAINPQMEVFFKDVDFRTFQFDFLFTPKSPDEAQSVLAIIEAFKFHAAPEIDYAQSAGGRYFIVPSVFDIQMYFNGQPNDKVNKYGICACETISVDYAPQSWVTHDDGMPVQIRMTLQFKECEIMTKDKISQGW